ncbi:MAG TPA: DNA-3-methyladenine glycosylase [Chloroflexota bacterium]|nr:DNA-3-methyladenine glycosylase [Chloroflexota bacterium]
MTDPAAPAAVNSSVLEPLPRAFYVRDTVEVARDLLGRYLAFQPPGQSPMIGRLVEVEAYLGERDLASHASHGHTRRTAPMYEEAGHAYIYLVYGMYWCLNAVTGAVGSPCAVLIRAVEPVEGLIQATDGPGKLCRAYGLDGRWNRADLTSSELRITAGCPVEATAIGTSPRIGVAYAGAWAREPLRFFDRTSRHVSRTQRSALRVNGSDRSS